MSDKTPRSGRGGRRFKSCHSDHYSNRLTCAATIVRNAATIVRNNERNQIGRGRLHIGVGVSLAAMLPKSKKGPGSHHAVTAGAKFWEDPPKGAITVRATRAASRAAAEAAEYQFTGLKLWKRARSANSDTQPGKLGPA